MNIQQKVKSFFGEVYVELKRTSWLSRKDVLRFTFIVLGVTVAVSLFLGLLDFIFSEIIKKLVF